MALGTGVLDLLVASGAGKGPVRFDLIHMPGDGAYPTGGTPGFEAYVREVLGLETNVDVLGVISGDSGIYVAQYDRANDKLKVRTMATGAEVADTTDLSGTTFNLIVISR